MNSSLDKPALIRRVNEEYEELKAPHAAGLCSLEKSTSSVRHRESSDNPMLKAF
jgi:hypothetical protein